MINIEIFFALILYYFLVEKFDFVFLIFFLLNGLLELEEKLFLNRA